MTVPHVRFHRAMAAVTLVVGLTVPSTASLVAGQAESGSLLARAAGEDDTLVQAKALYAAASYDEALEMLDRLTSTSKADKTAVAEYRIFCLLALGRQEDAQRAIESMLRDNPFYRPSDAQASPRIQATINDVRRQVLPAIVLRTTQSDSPPACVLGGSGLLLRWPRHGSGGCGTATREIRGDGVEIAIGYLGLAEHRHDGHAVAREEANRLSGQIGSLVEHGGAVAALVLGRQRRRARLATAGAMAGGAPVVVDLFPLVNGGRVLCQSGPRTGDHQRARQQ